MYVSLCVSVLSSCFNMRGFVCLCCLLDLIDVALFYLLASVYVSFFAYFFSLYFEF